MSKKFFYLLFLGTGVFILVQILMPLVWFKFWEWTEYSQNIALISPNLGGQILGISVENIDNFPAFISSNTRSYQPSYNQFYISIPSLKLDQVKVLVDSNKFDNNLAHLPGTALPGEKGNVFVTGHSSLPQFYRPSNYKAIFANLPSIKKGDQIQVFAGGQKYLYTVQGMKVVDPKEVGVINSSDESGRYLTLMTCVPPGFYLKRLIVLAKLAE